MGLDIVELVMDVEDAFGIPIPDDVAASLTTPRAVIEWIYARLPKDEGPRCLSQRAFYDIRNALVRESGLSRSQLRPETELFSVLPQSGAQRVWADVGESLGNRRWPRIRSGNWFAWLFVNRRPRTVGDAARYVATITPGAAKPPGEGWSWREVEMVFRELMWHHLGIREFSLDDHFVKDLGLG
jgi:hypothetical protein